MRSLSLVTLATALPVALAKTVTVCVQTGCGPSYSTLCKTSYALTSTWAAVGTTTLSASTITLHATAATTEMVTVTSTPDIVSTTTTATVLVTLTVPSITDATSQTTTITTTETPTTTVTATTTETETDSTTTTTTTTTTPAGFTPVADTYSSAIYPGDGQDYRARDKRKRALQPLSKRHGAGVSGIPILGNGTAWPVEVICEVQPIIYETRLIAETTTIDSTTTAWFTAPATETIDITVTARPQTITTTYTSTVTSTITVGPGDADGLTIISQTITETTTSTESTTETSTETTTLTMTSTATANGACQTDNVVQIFTIDGESVTPTNLYNNGEDGVSNFVSVQSIDEIDCCNICSTSTGCTASLYAGSGMCLLMTYGDDTSHTCQQDLNPLTFDYTDTDGGLGFYISNGLCGYSYYNGARGDAIEA